MKRVAPIRENDILEVLTAGNITVRNTALESGVHLVNVSQNLECTIKALLSNPILRLLIPEIGGLHIVIEDYLNVVIFLMKS